MIYWLLAIVTAALAYFFGCLDSIVIASNFIFHRNLRKLGRSSVFVSNFWRIYGWKGSLKLFLVELVLDLLPILIGGLLFGLKDQADVGRALAGFCLLMGRMWPMTNELRGGHGAVALIFASFGVDVSIGIAVLIVLVGAAAVSRMVSLGTLTGAAVLVLVSLLMVDKTLVLRLAIFMALIVVVRHIPAIFRISRGKEPRLSFEKDITYKLDEKF